jgi:mannitol/fructose-specific phosphotransferase system IIA component (Ntr-type)
MKSLSRLLSTDRIMWLDEPDKESCLRSMVERLVGSVEGLNAEDVYHGILEREKLLSTGFGLGLAIPHAKLKGIKDFLVGLGIHEKGVEFDSLDEKPVHVLVMILGPEHQQEDYLKVLARVTSFLKDNRERLPTMRNAQEIFELAYQY